MRTEYELTDNLYQDYNNLVSLYNQRNLKALTFTNDVNYHILLNLDIKDINNFCKSNKDARKICNSKEFWQLKYQQDDIPMEDFPDNLIDWIENYKLWKDASHIASVIMFVYSIEATRDNDQKIMMNIDMNKKHLVKYILPQIYNKINNLYDYTRLVIKYINNDVYNMTIRTLDGNSLSDSYKININTDDLKNILIRCNYSTLTKDAISIRDNDNISFYITPRILQLEIRLPNTNRITLYRRLSMRDTYEFLKL